MILLDTDILIDVALDRRPHSDEATELKYRLQKGPRKAIVAWQHAVELLLPRGPPA
ncbi:hypothetical protein [Candidatus Palauibacter sp.]|uniref:hypothetical protein n=1 Tax=Candidatus Palauibacter sp. TaxID=3101350 RepID=UPI003B52BAD2